MVVCWAALVGLMGVGMSVGLGFTFGVVDLFARVHVTRHGSLSSPSHMSRKTRDVFF